MPSEEHFRDVCTCGAVIRECRCPGPKQTTKVPHGCANCRDLVRSRRVSNAAGSGLVQNIPPKEGA